MAKTAIFSAGIGALVAWNWARLEEPHPQLGVLALMTALGIVPALLPRRWRPLSAVALLVAAGSIALQVYPWAIGRLAGDAVKGFLDFYHVGVPFDGAAHPLMHGVLLIAVFVFSALAALGVPAPRP